MQNPIEKAEGKLGILLPGMGAVATTLIAGVAAVKKDLAQPKKRPSTNLKELKWYEKAKRSN